MEENEAQFPNKIFKVHHVLEDGDLVAAHSHLRMKPDEPANSVVHIFRFENDRIAELWDIGQLISQDSPNANGPF